MNENIANTTFLQATNHFETAREELARPEEDVVAYMVCNHAYKAVQHYLTAFLQSQGEQVHTANPLDALLNACRQRDERFNALDISALLQLQDPEDVWMNVDVARYHLELAAKARDLVQPTRAS
ncbi:MAG TPA: hypothetical protein DHW15_12250 [Bacteroidetes bacterium]|jgi:HEPN domain-containing protein|nr:MAG: hypothetical protein ABR94_10750 [Sphingobacteriales bacterium BACL12 MAG-120802-bin5]HCK22890.1 hypothetical protein [Bacteroidota bacterium]